jgi:universal stress protein E
MDRSKNILVAVDFSPCSADALRQAARIASWTGASVNAIHVVSVEGFVPYPHPLAPMGVPVPPVDELVRNAKARWATFVKDCPGREKIPLDIQVGNPRDRILDKVYQERPDLLFVGAHSTEDRARAIGATAGALVQRAACKVVVVRQGQGGKFKSVAVCVDFSDASRVAMEQAVRVAAQDDAALHVLNVYTDPWQGLVKPQQVQDMMPDFNARFERAVEERLQEFCRPLAHEMGALKAEYHGRMSSSHGEAIVAFVQTNGCDLVVLGTRGKWSLRDFFWGSTAERVVRDCPCSVLAVKPPGFQQIEPYQPLAGSEQPREARGPGRAVAGVGAG